MKLENTVAILSGAATALTCAVFDLHPVLLVVASVIATFGGWMLGCLLEIILEYRHTKDPDPYYPPHYDDF